MKLTETYNKMLAEELLGEKRMEFSELEGMAVFVVETNKWYDITLVDLEWYEDLSRGIRGFISLYKKGEDFEVRQVAAKKGYGLVMYELGMQTVYPNGIASSRDGATAEGAFRLYQYFYKGFNPNVEIETIEGEAPEDKQFSKEETILYNSVYKMKPNEISSLKSKGDQLLAKDGKMLKKELEEVNYWFFNHKIEGY